METIKQIGQVKLRRLIQTTNQYSLITHPGYDEILNFFFAEKKESHSLSKLISDSLAIVPLSSFT